MASNLPTGAMPGLELLARLDEAALRNLIAALRATQPRLQTREIAAAIRSSWQQSEPDLVAIIDALVELQSFKSFAGMMDAGIVDAVTQQFAAHLKIGPDVFKRHLSELLDLDIPLGVVARARTILLEFERGMSDIRVLTDIRPIFGKDVTRPPVAVAIIQNLRITYYQDGEFKDFFVAMDGADLAKMRIALERAEYKAESIRNALKATNFSTLIVD
jgi:hypothetical protein